MAERRSIPVIGTLMAYVIQNVLLQLPARPASFIPMPSRWAFTLLWLTTGLSSVFAGTFTVTVRVVDMDNKPVPKAELALLWNVNGAMMATASQGTLTDESGKAVLQPDDWNEKRAVLVLSSDRKLGGIVGVSKADDGNEVTVNLAPTVHIKGKLACTELNSKPRWANTMVTPDGFRAQFAQHMNESAEFEFALPAGKYVLRSYGTDVEDIKQTIMLAADRAEYDLGTLDFKASSIAKLKGKPAPGWDVTAARSVKPAVKLSDYKGKWVYLEFWGFW